MAEIDPIRFGASEAKLEALTIRLINVEMMTMAMNQKLDSVLISLAERKGQLTTVKYVAGLAAGFASIVVTLLLRWFGYGQS